jgi:hypothetical protein
MSRIIELRQYTLKPGQRNVLIELFEREFIESQETVGMDILGTFCDADNPDRFVWLRGFPDVESRAKSLAAFYGGPVWKAHREVANATMLDSDNVLLLRPAWMGSGLAPVVTRPPSGATDLAKHVVIATICSFEQPISQTLLDAFRAAMPAMFAAETRACFLGAFASEHSPNTFPALPVREGENVLVWFARAPNGEARVGLPPVLEKSLAKPPEVLRLLPTARSAL